MQGKPKLAVWKFASCDGCQLSLLDCEDDLLHLVEHIEIAYFLEASRAVVQGPYDISLVEGSITTAEDAERIQHVRRVSRHVVTIGACATSGGIQALRNYTDMADLVPAVYAHPEYVNSLDTSTPIAAHIAVDFELHGCPINKHQLLEVVLAALQKRKPAIRAHSVCVECKRRGTVCVLVSEKIPCLGPITHAGCGALCPTYRRGCYGCYGPSEVADVRKLLPTLQDRGATPQSLQRSLSLFSVADDRFAQGHGLVPLRTKTSFPPSQLAHVAAGSLDGSAPPTDENRISAQPHTPKGPRT